MVELEGYVDHIVYRNADNGYTVLVLSTEYGEETLVGTFRAIDEGERIKAYGEFIHHPSYGEQLKVSEVKVLEIEDAYSMERYLSSGAIKGIGAKMAKKIIKAFGDDTFRIMDEEPERLAEIKGISMRLASEIAAQMEEKRGVRKAMMFLQDYGISMTMSMKIYNKYGARLFEILKDNPYKLCEDIDGIGFIKADEIAAKIGIENDSPYRIRSGILYVLNASLSEGHTYLPKDILIEKSSEMMSISSGNIDEEIANLSAEKKLICKDNDIYSLMAYYMELSTARLLFELNIETSDKSERIKSEIEGIIADTDLELDEDQMKAIISSAQAGVSIITGGPGTGKTTIIKLLLEYFTKEGMDIMLCAPTGRAAKRMSETTGYEAKTIHRLLEITGDGSQSFSRNEENPLETDVVIVDEMSMVDIFTFNALLKAIPVGSKLIMVGDVNQLPSVGAGAVLRDIIDANRYSVSTLHHIFRQAGESDIVISAHKVNNGEAIALDNKSKDFFFLERNDTEVILQSIEYLVMKKLPGYLDTSPLDIQVLTPMKKGVLGSINLNKYLQEKMNPQALDKEEYTFGDFLFREGDKVMQIKNDYQLEWEITGNYGIAIESGLGVFNGDMGFIKRIDKRAEIIEVIFDENKIVKYQFSQIEELELAYAITVHKSQGSEYPAIVMPLLTGPAMLMNRNLLYTAITRAKKCVMIVGSAKCVQEVIANKREQIRYTGLKERILEIGFDEE